MSGAIRKVVNAKVGYVDMQELALRVLALLCMYSMNVKLASENGKISGSSRENIVLVKTGKKRLT